MSLKPLESHFGPTQSLYAPYTASGGGGGGTVSQNISSLSVSSIVGLGGAPIEIPALLEVSSIGGALGPNGLTVFNNGMELLAGGEVRFDAEGLVNFSDNQGSLVGVSTINGAPYRAFVAPASIVGPFSVTVGHGATATPLTSWATTPGHAYSMGGIGVLQLNDAGTINPEDVTYMSLADGASILSAFNTSQISLVSTIATTGGVAFSLAQSWVATNATASVVTGNTGLTGGPSTTATIAKLVLQDLGIPIPA